MNTQGKPLNAGAAAIYAFDDIVKQEKWIELNAWYLTNAPWLTQNTVNCIIEDIKLEFLRNKDKIQ